MASPVELLTTIIDFRVIATLIDTEEFCDGTLWAGNIAPIVVSLGLLDFVERKADEIEYYELNAKGKALVELHRLLSK